MIKASRLRAMDQVYERKNRIPIFNNEKSYTIGEMYNPFFTRCKNKKDAELYIDRVSSYILAN